MLARINLSSPNNPITDKGILNGIFIQPQHLWSDTGSTYDGFILMGIIITTTERLYFSEKHNIIKLLYYISCSF